VIKVDLSVIRTGTCPLRVAAVVLIALTVLSSCATGGPSGASQVTMGLLGLLNLKSSTLARVQAGLPFVDDSGLQPAPNKAFTDKFLVTVATVEGHAVYTLAPRGKPPTSTVLYLHGGAYSVSFVNSHWQLFRDLMERTGCTIVAPDYPLPPEADWRVSWAMVRTVYASLVTGSSDSAPLLMGDSAGGGFALALAQELAASTLVNPQRVILLSPWLDLTLSNPEIALMQNSDRLLSVEALRIVGRRWSGETPATDWHLSPLGGRLDNLPPVTLFTGTADVLNPDARKLRDHFVSQGLDLDYHEYPGMMHVWMLFDFPESRSARNELFRRFP